MSPQVRPAKPKEADLTERVVKFYRRAFASLIARMTRNPADRSDIECMRMCVEAVDVTVRSRGAMTGARREPHGDHPVKKSAA